MSDQNEAASGTPEGDGQPGQGTYGQGAYGQPGATSDGQPTYGQPAQPSYGQPAYGEPAQPAYGQASPPAYGQPSQPPVPTYGQPAQPPVPTYGQPAQPAQPTYGQPAQPVYGQPMQPGYPQPGYGAYVPAPATGRVSWGLTFLLYIPIPGINVIATLIAVLMTRSSAKRSGSPLAIGNANAASNFLLSFIIYFVVLYLAIIAIGVSTQSASDDPSPLIMLPALLLLATGIWALVWMIVGVVSSSRRVVNAVPVIPFFR